MTAPDRPEVPVAYAPGLDGLRAVGLLVMPAYSARVSVAMRNPDRVKNVDTVKMPPWAVATPWW